MNYNWSGITHQCITWTYKFEKGKFESYIAFNVGVSQWQYIILKRFLYENPAGIEEAGNFQEYKIITQ